MSKQRHYKHAPITEALIDLRVTPADGLTLDMLRSIRNGHEEAYPTEQTQFVGQLNIQPGEGVMPLAQQRRTGFVYKSVDERQLVQVKRDGFTFNRLALYPTWKDFSSEARFWWERYRSVVQPKAITRLAVRYINRLELSLESVDLKTYIKTYPWVSEDLQQNHLSGYFMQLQIPQPDMKAMLVLSQALEGSAHPSSISVILDIDLFREDDIPIGEEAIWEYFEQLRHRKNHIFESSITDSMREILDHDDS